MYIAEKILPVPANPSLVEVCDSGTQTIESSFQKEEVPQESEEDEFELEVDHDAEERRDPTYVPPGHTGLTSSDDDIFKV